MHSFDFRHYTAVDSTFDLKKKKTLSTTTGCCCCIFFPFQTSGWRCFYTLGKLPEVLELSVEGPMSAVRKGPGLEWRHCVNSVSTLLFKRHYYITTHSSWKKKTLTLLLQLCLVVDVVMNANMNISKVWLKRLGDLWYFECKHCHVKAIATDDSIIVFLYIKNNVNFNHRSCDKFGEFKKKFN